MGHDPVYRLMARDFGITGLLGTDLATIAIFYGLWKAPFIDQVSVDLREDKRGFKNITEDPWRFVGNLKTALHYANGEDLIRNFLELGGGWLFEGMGINAETLISDWKAARSKDPRYTEKISREIEDKFEKIGSLDVAPSLPAKKDDGRSEMREAAGNLAIKDVKKLQKIKPDFFELLETIPLQNDDVFLEFFINKLKAGFGNSVGMINYLKKAKNGRFLISPLFVGVLQNAVFSLGLSVKLLDKCLTEPGSRISAALNAEIENSIVREGVSGLPYELRSVMENPEIRKMLAANHRPQVQQVRDFLASAKKTIEEVLRNVPIPRDEGMSQQERSEMRDDAHKQTPAAALPRVWWDKKAKAYKTSRATYGSLWKGIRSVLRHQIASELDMWQAGGIKNGDRSLSVARNLRGGLLRDMISLGRSRNREISGILQRLETLARNGEIEAFRGQVLGLYRSKITQEPDLEPVRRHLLIASEMVRRYLNKHEAPGNIITQISTIGMPAVGQGVLFEIEASTLVAAVPDTKDGLVAKVLDQLSKAESGLAASDQILAFTNIYAIRYVRERTLGKDQAAGERDAFYATFAELRQSLNSKSVATIAEGLSRLELWWQKLRQLLIEEKEGDLFTRENVPSGLPKEFLFGPSTQTVRSEIRDAAAELSPRAIKGHENYKSHAELFNAMEQSRKVPTVSGDADSDGKNVPRCALLHLRR